MTYQLGRLPNDPDKHRLSLSKHMGTSTAPATADWFSRVTDWGMLANDRLPDCVCAGQAHALLSLTTYASNNPVRLTEQETVALYSTLSGWHQGDDPSSAPGLVVQDALNFWRTSGINGHNITVFAAVDIARLDDVRTAVSALGCVFVGINFPQSAMDQFNAGQSWDVTAQDGGIIGGHLVLVTGYNEQDSTYTCVTWGQTQVMTEAFWKKYVEECWVAIAPEWVESGGNSPSGLDLYGLGEDFAQATNTPNPFPPAPVIPPSSPPTRTDHTMTAVQDHINAAVTALGDARTSIEVEVSTLKDQVKAKIDTPSAPEPDFSALDAEIAKLSGDAPSPEPSPAPAPPVAPPVDPSAPPAQPPVDQPPAPVPADPNAPAPANPNAPADPGNTPPVTPPADPNAPPTDPNAPPASPPTTL